MVAVCARQTVALVPQTLRVYAETVTLSSPPKKIKKKVIKGNVLFKVESLKLNQ